MSTSLPVLPALALTPECVATHAITGPRYTSYPPATEFAPIAAGDVTAELARIGGLGQPVSLYVHVPFCRELCWYCGCNVTPTRNSARGDGYVDMIATELGLLRAQLGAKVEVTELALGGGSPNFLTPAQFRTLLHALDQAFAFAPDTRRSVEFDPRETSNDQVLVLAEHGFRSLSIGIQDFAVPVQDAIHRHQSVEQTQRLVDQGRAAGFDDINADIVYGLPHQTETSFVTTLGHVLDLAPDRIALFGYAHLPDRLPHQRLVERAGRLPDSLERAGLLLAGIKVLTDAGYLHLGLDHFARPGSALAIAAATGRLARTFQGYSERRADTILGLGPSAISNSDRMFWQNLVEVPDWEKALAAGELPIHRGVALDLDDRIRRAVIGGLMCNGEIDLTAIEREFDIDAASYFAAELDAVAADVELATVDRAARRITTTEIGRLLVRNVCMRFDRYLGTRSNARFSPTV